MIWVGLKKVLKGMLIPCHVLRIDWWYWFFSHC